MNIQLWATIVAVLIAVCLAALLKFLRENEKLPYYSSNKIQTDAELSFFKVLEKAVGDSYYIFPQVRLASLVKINAHGKNWWRYFGRIKSKSVDFVLADKQTTATRLVIELDDISHNEIARQDRDAFVDGVFKTAQIPLLRIRKSHGYTVSTVKNAIQEKLLS